MICNTFQLFLSRLAFYNSSLGYLSYRSQKGDRDPVVCLCAILRLSVKMSSGIETDLSTVHANFTIHDSVHFLGPIQNQKKDIINIIYETIKVCQGNKKVCIHQQ